jgi:FKBP-type peptidyl-prolyl cis-trans isomerase 2
MRPLRILLLAVALVLAAAACGDSASDADAPLDDASTTEAPGDTTTVPGDTTTEAPAETTTTSGVAREGSPVDGDTVTLHYTGTLDSGEQFDSSVGGDPFSFVVGSGGVIAGFDVAVRDMAVGEKKTVRIPPQDAYGERSDDFIVEFPIEQAPEGLVVGDQVALSNGQPATVVAVTDTTITIDANHPLAGEALTFELELLSIT